MKRRLFTTLACMICFTIVTTSVTAGTATLSSNNTVPNTWTSPIKTRTLSVTPKTNNVPPIQHEITYIASRPAAVEDVVLTLDIDGNMTYSHTQGHEGFGAERPLDINISDKLDPATVRFAFAMMAAGGFADFPDEFPIGTSYKDGFDTWLTLDTPDGATKTVYAPSSGMVSDEFEVIRSVFESITEVLENEVVLSVVVRNEYGGFVGSLDVQADGDARIRSASNAGPNSNNVKETFRHFNASRMEGIAEQMAAADFFNLSLCSDSNAAALLGADMTFEVTYNAGGNSHTVQFGAQSETKDALSALVDWTVRAIN